jgi:dihydrofolate reductase
MIVISAMSKDRVIGSGKGMPWSVPGEYEQYLRFVSGQTVIMGRKSYEIFGPDLPAGTTAIVISRSAMLDGVVVVKSLDEALAVADGIGKTVFVAGGGSIYTQAVPLADEMYLSTIKGDFEGDAYFPEFDANDWEITEERDEPEFVFRKYRRIRPSA